MRNYVREETFVDPNCARCDREFERAGDGHIFWAELLCSVCFQMVKHQIKFYRITPITAETNYSFFLNPVGKIFPIGK